MTITPSAALMDAIVLSVVARDGTYGYKITQDIRSVMEISESTLYPVLRRLQKEGYLDVYDQEFAGRNRRYYRITTKGRALLAESLTGWEDYKSKLDRVFYAGAEAFLHKPAAVVVTARRAGTTASLDVLNKYLLNAEMPVVSSTYWNMVFGPAPELVEQDKEGLQTMRNLGRNMAWLLGCIEAGRQQGRTPPQAEQAHWTNFNR